MKRGFTLIELLVGMSLMAMLVLGSMTLFVSSMRSLQRTTNDVTITDKSAVNLRKVTEKVREAITVTVTNQGKTLSFNLPKFSASVDPITQEKEVAIPAASDGIARGYAIDFGAGTLRDTQTGKVLMRNIASTDVNTGSSQYGQAYEPFQITTVGTTKALTICLITRDSTSGQLRTMRMKTTTVLRNMP
jgi:prepilin-type N-terminal cleavage/methylation domain-containing protein